MSALEAVIWVAIASIFALGGLCLLTIAILYRIVVKKVSQNPQTPYNLHTTQIGGSTPSVKPNVNSCFISYSSHDEEFARRLRADLRDHNIHCWYAPADMKIGSKLLPSIREAVQRQEKLILILSKYSIQSVWVELEVEEALEEEQKRGRIVLYPLSLDKFVMKTTKSWAAEIIRTRHIGDFTHWKDHDQYMKSFIRLLRDLQSASKVN